MPPTPDWSRGSIFLPHPRYLSNWSGGASVFLSPAGVQLSWGPRPGESVFASERKEEKQKSPPALSRLRPAICRAISELTPDIVQHQKLRFLFPQLPLRVTFRIVEKKDWSVSGEVGRSWRYCNVRPTRDGAGASSWTPSPYKNQFNIEENTWFSYQILSW